jgi:hypothetical protein
MITAVLNNRKCRKKIMLLLFVGAVFIWIVSSCTLMASASRTLECNHVKKAADIKPGFINYTIIPGKDKYDTVIRVYDSYFVRNQNEIREILVRIIQSENGQACNLSEEDLPRYIAEWVTHNFAYYNPELASIVLGKTTDEIIDSAQHSDLNLNDKYADIYWMYYCFLYQ